MTPSLNKSFKFQSDWPYNNSQVYLLNSILEDLKEDEDRKFEMKEDGYYFSSSVNYPNNRSLIHQNVYIDKNGKIKKVEVVDKDDNVQIIMNFKTIEFDKKFDKNYFELSSILKINENSSKKDSTRKDAKENSEIKETDDNITNNNVNEKNQNDSTINNDTEKKLENNQSQNSTDNTKTTASINDVIYPMYLPDNTYLTSKETIETENGERLILTFGGDSSFILVEEVVTYDEAGLIIPVSGEFDFLSDVIGVIGVNSLTWHSNGIEYYLASDTIETSELIEIARSVSVLPVSK